MKRMEVKHFEDFTRKYYPNFKLGNDELVSTWVSTLTRFSLNECERAVTVYYANAKQRYEPTLGQLKELLEANEAKTHEPSRTYEPDYDLKYMKKDKESGDMNWAVPHYSQVLALIRRDRYPFVQNIYHPTHEEFRECMRRWCQEKYGRAHYFFSDNEIAAMTPEKQQQLLERAKQVFSGFALKNFN